MEWHSQFRCVCTWTPCGLEEGAGSLKFQCGCSPCQLGRSGQITFNTNFSDSLSCNALFLPTPLLPTGTRRRALPYMILNRCSWYGWGSVSLKSNDCVWSSFSLSTPVTSFVWMREFWMVKHCRSEECLWTSISLVVIRQNVAAFWGFCSVTL